MTLPLPHPVIEDQQVQQNFEVLAGQFPPFGIRISWGVIKGSDASILAGSRDYTAARGGAGLYTITWTRQKAGVNYALLLTTDNQGGAASMGINQKAPAATANFQVSVFTLAPLANADPTYWSFLVIDTQ